MHHPRIPAPDSDTVDSGKRALEELARLPPAMEQVRVGDTLRIVRDAGRCRPSRRSTSPPSMN